MSDTAANLVTPSADEIQSAAAKLLAQLEKDGDFGVTPDDAYTALVIPLWMVPHILRAPEDTIAFLENLSRADIPPQAYARLGQFNPDQLGYAIFNSVRDRDPRDVEANQQIIAKLLMGIGIFAGLSMLIALHVALILAKLGPIGAVLGLIVLLIGLAILVISTAIMVIITVVRTIIGKGGAELTFTVRPASATGS
jgi:hypothetical protein